MASSLYTFNSTVLSSGKYSNPTVTNASLSSYGVGIISISGIGNYGVAFNRKSPLTTQVTTITANGTVLTIDNIYHGSTMMVLSRPTNLAFLFLSGSAVALSLSSVSESSTPEQQRKHWLGQF